MAHEFRLPDIGEGLTEAEIVRWLVAEGDQVDADQPIVEVETDKAVVEIPSPYAGTVLRHGGAEGDVVRVGEVLVVIGSPGDSEGAGDDDVEPSGDETRSSADAPPIVGTLSEEAEVIASSPEPAASGAAGVKALPLVRKLAREHGIDIASIEGSGPDGRITREDVEAAIAAQDRPSVETDEEPAGPPEGDERRPMSRLRRTIAAHMSRSWAEIPHVTAFEDVDATRLLEVRAALAERHGTRIPLEALVVKAVIPALRAFPELNATIDGDDLILHGSHHIGIAVDTDEGLMVGVIRDADSRGVLELAEEVRRLGEGARARTLSPDDLAGQTFTISNIGAVGGGHGTPIVPHGTTAILSVGLAVARPVVYDGDLAIAPVMPLSLSYDHRVVDGALGRRFMGIVIENLEEPALFLAG